MKLYVVRNKEGKFFRPKGFGGYGSNWKDKLEQAKFYPKIGQAKARVTYFAKHFPKYGVCDVLEFTLDASLAVVLNMEQETNDAIQKAIEVEKLAEQRKMEYEIQRKQAELDARRCEFARWKQSKSAGLV
jgi:hypothetical protein